MSRFEQLLKEKEQHLSVFAKAKAGLESCVEKLKEEIIKADTAIVIKKLEIDAENEAINDAYKHTKVINRQIKNINKIID